MPVNGLTPEESEKLKSAILKRESSGNYQNEKNPYGYIGGFQFGAEALQAVGLIRPGIVTAYGNLGGSQEERAANHKKLLDNPANWVNPPGSKEAYLNNKELQDKSFYDLANKNRAILSAKGVITPGTSAGDTAGYLAAAHLKGVGGAINLSKGSVTKDANGTPTTEYFKLGKQAVTGSSDLPPNIAAGAAAVSSSPGPNTQTPKTLSALKSTSLPNAITVSATSYKDDFQLPMPNPLSSLVSFNCIFTLSSISNRHVNFPDTTYKSGDLGAVILRSGGGLSDNRVSTGYTSEYNPSGKFEYFIDNVAIESLLSYSSETKGSNSINIEFDVLEPYSMGVFLQSLQIAAKQSGHLNYLESPFLLTIEFIGYDSNGQATTVPFTTRHIPFRMNKADMEVTASGCKYSVAGYPWNEVALTDLHNLLKTDVGISGKTVQEILQSGKNSLQYVINHGLQTMAQSDKTTFYPDEIVILFPKDLTSGAPSSQNSENEPPAKMNPNQASDAQAVTSKLTIRRAENLLLTQASSELNELGSSSMGFDLTTGGQSALTEDNFAYDEKSGRYFKSKITFDPKSRMFMFAQGTSIVNAITEILLMSEYCKKAIASNKNDQQGMKQWFRIETQTYNLDPGEGNLANGRVPKLLIFKVVPYSVHSSRFTAPSSAPEGYDKLKQQAVKQYDYIYTGKNTEVLDFNIGFKTSFFTVAYADKNQNNKDIQNPQHISQGGKTTAKQSPSNQNENRGNEPGVGQVQQGNQHFRSKSNGGGPADNDKSLIARQFHEALLNSKSDLVTADLTILGDPYYIADSGLGNYSNTGTTPKINLTDSGGMDYQRGEVDIVVNFRTPLDINSITGVMDFGNTELVQGFSGLFQILKISNNFASGKFTQTLSLLRRPKQFPTEVDTTKQSSSDAAAVPVGNSNSPDAATASPTGQSAPKMESSSVAGKSTPLVSEDPVDKPTDLNDWWG